MHIALETCIYRVSNVGPHFINCVVDCQNYGPNWSLYHDIERSVAPKLSVFVTASIVASCILLRPVHWACSWIVSRHTLMMSRHKLYSVVLFLLREECLRSRHKTCLHPTSHVLVLLEFVTKNNCFSVFQLCRYRVSLSSQQFLSRQETLWS